MLLNKKKDINNHVGAGPKSFVYWIIKMRLNWGF